MISRWPPRVVAFLLWMLAALAGSYWLLKIIGLAETPIRAGTIAAEAPSVNTADLLRVLGPAVQGIANPVAGTPLAQDAGAKMQLLGVVTGRRDAGIALIALEGQPARPFRVGSRISDAYRLARVTTRTAILAPAVDGAAAITLELAPIPNTVNAAPTQLPMRPAFPLGQSPFPVPVLPPALPRALLPALPRPLLPAPAGPLPPAAPVDASKD